MADAGSGPRERLWTPWRMAYVSGSSRSAGCVFCDAPAEVDDAKTLILHRGVHSFVILNLYPYNTGHLMVVPYEHVNRPEAMQPEARAEMAELVASFSHGVSYVTGCDGLNIGMNLGSAAGAGIADHLHQHLVPRWIGDANFMPIVGGTKVLPELLPVTYGKLRAEICRQKTDDHRVALVLMEGDGVWLDDGGSSLPAVEADGTTPLWKAAATALGNKFAAISLLGWAGPASVTSDTTIPPALAFTVTSDARSPQSAVRVSTADAMLSLIAIDRTRLTATIQRFAHDVS